MKIIFVSDIHGIVSNLNELKKVIDTINPNKVVVLGDLYQTGYIKSEKENNFLVKEFLGEYIDKLIVLKGNCDSLIELSKNPFLVINDLGLINTDDINIYLNHGDKYNIYNNTKIEDGVLVYGHEHVPYIREENNVVYINVGSISLPRNNSDPSYAVYENRIFKIYSILTNEVLYEKEIA